MRYWWVLLLLFLAGGCSAEMVNLDSKFNDIDTKISANTAKVTQVENDFNVYKASMNTVLQQIQQDIINFMPPGFVMCIVSTDTAHNWEIQYPSDTIKVDYIENVILP